MRDSSGVTDPRPLPTRPIEQTRERVIEALGAPNPPPGADPAKVYILGIDVDRAGLADVKLYFRLDRALLPRAVENAGALADLLAGTRLVVLQQCLLRPERRQIYLHATNADVLTRWIDRRRDTAATKVPAVGIAEFITGKLAK